MLVCQVSKTFFEYIWNTRTYGNKSKFDSNLRNTSYRKPFWLTTADGSQTTTGSISIKIVSHIEYLKKDAKHHKGYCMHQSNRWVLV